MSIQTSCWFNHSDWTVYLLLNFLIQSTRLNQPRNRQFPYWQFITKGISCWFNHSDWTVYLLLNFLIQSTRLNQPRNRQFPYWQFITKGISCWFNHSDWTVYLFLNFLIQSIRLNQPRNVWTIQMKLSRYIHQAILHVDRQFPYWHFITKGI